MSIPFCFIDKMAESNPNHGRTLVIMLLDTMKITLQEERSGENLVMLMETRLDPMDYEMLMVDLES